MAMVASGAALALLGMRLESAFAQTPEAVDMVIQQATYRIMDAATTVLFTPAILNLNCNTNLANSVS